MTLSKFDVEVIGAKIRARISRIQQGLVGVDDIPKEAAVEQLYWVLKLVERE